jgi:sugar lactone lactonase YvrE
MIWLGMIGVSEGQTISTIAGGGLGFLDIGDGGPAASASFSRPVGVFVDRAGNLYIVDSGNDRIRKIDLRGMIATAAGGGTRGQGMTSAVVRGDGGPATLANFQPYGPSSVYVDGEGSLYITQVASVRKVDGGGTITSLTIGAWPVSNSMNVYVDSLHNIYIATDRVIQKMVPLGIVSNIAGVPDSRGFSGDGGPATDARFQSLRGIFGDGSGNLFLADAGNNRIRKVSPSGIITTVAGNGTQGFSGDGGPATEASLKLLDESDNITQPSPVGVFVDPLGNLFISDVGNNRIRKVDSSGIITTVAGNGTAGFSGDGGPATEASLWAPRGVSVDGAGNLYIADTGNNLIRKVSASLTMGLLSDKSTITADGKEDAVIEAQVLNTEGMLLTNDNLTRVKFEILSGEGTLSVVEAIASGGIASVRLVSGVPGAVTVQVSAANAVPATVSVDVKTTVTPEMIRAPDLIRDGKVAFADFLGFALHFGKGPADADYESKFDLDGDQSVGFNDFLLFVQSFGQSVVDAG